MGLPLSLSSSFSPDCGAFFPESNCLTLSYGSIESPPPTFVIVSPPASHPPYPMRFLSSGVVRGDVSPPLTCLDPLRHSLAHRFLLWLLFFTSFHFALIPQHDGSRSAHTPLMSRTSFITVFLSLCFLKGCTNQPPRS